MEIVDVASSFEAMPSNHSSVVFYTGDVGLPSYKEALNIHASDDVSYDADAYVDVYVDVYEDVDVDEGVNGPS